MAELKPCPFCGSTDVIFVEMEEQHCEDKIEGFVLCRGCYFSSDIFQEDIVTAKWNRRAENATD